MRCRSPAAVAAAPRWTTVCDGPRRWRRGRGGAAVRRRCRAVAPPCGGAAVAEAPRSRRRRGRGGAAVAQAPRLPRRRGCRGAAVAEAPRLPRRRGCVGAAAAEAAVSRRTPVCEGPGSAAGGGAGAGRRRGAHGMLIAGPNLTIDRTWTIHELRPGDVLRFTTLESPPAARASTSRGRAGARRPAMLVAFVPGRIGPPRRRMIEAEGIALRRVPARGEIRSTSVVIEPSGRTTVMNEPGPTLPRRRLGRLRGGDRRPPPPATTACSSARAACRRGRRTAPTAASWRAPARGRARRSSTPSGDARRERPPPARRRPAQPRRGRAPARTATARRSTPSPTRGRGRCSRRGADRPRRAIGDRHRGGRRRGGRRRHGRGLARGAERDRRNPIGAGDVFAAGFAAALERRADLREAARSAIAAGAASVEIRWPAGWTLRGPRSSRGWWWSSRSRRSDDESGVPARGRGGGRRPRALRRRGWQARGSGHREAWVKRGDAGVGREVPDRQGQVVPPRGAPPNPPRMR